MSLRFRENGGQKYIQASVPQNAFGTSKSKV